MAQDLTLVTGANGFLAANIVRELNRRGLPVRGLVRKNAGLRALEGAAWEPCYGSYLNPADLDRAIRNCKVVIHVAAFTGPTPSALKYYLEPNVEGTREVAEACLIHQVKRLIYVSSVNSIGYGSADYPGTEERPIGGPPFSRLGYAVSKLMAEDIIREYARDKGLDAVIVNPSFMIGPYDAKPSSNRILLMHYERACSLVPPGGKNFVDVRDVATAICNAVERGRAGERYILAHENLTINEFFDKVDSVTGHKQRRIQVPAALIRFLGMLGGIANIFGRGYPLDPVTAHILCIRNFYSAEKAIRELGMPQTPIEEAIKAGWDWLNSE